MILGILGAISGVGTTMVAQSIAEELKEKGKSVLMIFASSNYDDQYVERGDSGGIDDLKKMRDISRKDIELSIEKGKSFDYISGVENIAETMRFYPEIIEKIASVLNYDYVVCDLGFSPVFPLTFSGIMCADKRYYVLDQSEKSRVRFRKTYYDILKSLGIDMSGDEILLNKERKSGVQYTKKDIEELFLMKVRTIPFAEGAYLAEIDKKSLMHKSAFRKAIKRITSEI